MQNSTNNILNAKCANDMQNAKHKTHKKYIKYANIILFIEKWIYPKYTNNIPLIY